MKNIKNALKIDKKLNRIILVLVVLIILLSIILLIYAVGSDKKTSLQYKSKGSGKLMGQGHRHFSIESMDEHIYNLGEYQVNLTANRFLIVNLSVKSDKDSFESLQERNVLVQNAVLEAFFTHDSVHLPNTAWGKNKIKEKIKENINARFQEPPVEEIYFNKFIIQ